MSNALGSTQARDSTVLGGNLLPSGVWRFVMLSIFSLQLIIVPVSDAHAGQLKWVKKPLGLFIAAAVSGIVSGVATVEASERYRVKRTFLKEGYFVPTNKVIGVASDGMTVWLPAGSYRTLGQGENGHGVEFIVVEYREIEKLVVVYL